MAALRIKLVRSMSGHPESHRATLRGLGLTRVGRERVLEDTPAIRGMVKKVGYLVQMEETQDKFEKFGRRARAKRTPDPRAETTTRLGTSMPRAAARRAAQPISSQAGRGAGAGGGAGGARRQSPATRRPRMRRGGGGTKRTDSTPSSQASRP